MFTSLRPAAMDCMYNCGYILLVCIHIDLLSQNMCAVREEVWHHHAFVSCTHVLLEFSLAAGLMASVYEYRAKTDAWFLFLSAGEGTAQFPLSGQLLLALLLGCSLCVACGFRTHSVCSQTRSFSGCKSG